MSNIGSMLKQEIARVARREIRAEIGTTKKASTQHRRHITMLRKQVRTLERQVSSLASKVAGNTASSAAPDPSSAPARQIRFLPNGLRSLRSRLGLSAADFGRLVGVSGQSIHNWEHKVTTPRSAQLKTLAAVRGIGKREATARLEGMGTKSTKPRNGGNKQQTRSG